MSDGISDHVTYLERCFEEWKERERKSFLPAFTTKEIVEELCKREGVKEIVVPPYAPYKIEVDDKYICANVLGTARILVVID